MTDEQIIKALECCAELNYADFGNGLNICRQHCPYKANCYDKEKNINMITDALDLINRLQAENEKWQGGYMTQKQEIANLEIEFKAMRGEANSYKAENERLKAHIKEGIDLAKEIPEKMLLVRAEAIKEFAERVEKLKFPNAHEPKGYVIYGEDFDNLVKEMVGEE